MAIGRRTVTLSFAVTTLLAVSCEGVHITVIITSAGGRSYYSISQMKELEQQFEAVLNELSTSLTARDVEQIRELVDAHELGIAFENFCTQLYERDAVCSPAQINQLAAIGNVMGIKPDYWKNIPAR